MWIHVYTIHIYIYIDTLHVCVCLYMHTQRLKCISFFGQYIRNPKKKIGLNHKGTTLEPLGIYMYIFVYTLMHPRHAFIH